MIRDGLIDSPTTSIAMATYNGARFLTEQLESFLRQTRLPDELVACDDGSTDATLDILEAFSMRAPFTVRIVRNPRNLGFTANFSQAIALCHCDLVFLADQDDVWFPDKVETLVQKFVDLPRSLILVHDGRLVDEAREWSGATKLGQIRAGWRSEAPLVAGALSAMRRELGPLVLPVPHGVIGHDVWIHLLARHLGLRSVVDIPLQDIRRHGDNTSEWVAASVQRINWLTVFRRNAETSPASSYADRIHINDAVRERLVRIRAMRSVWVDEACLDRADAYFGAERVALEHRTRMLARGPLGRRLAAAGMLARGDYRHFNGFNSFLRDLRR